MISFKLQNYIKPVSARIDSKCCNYSTLVKYQRSNLNTIKLLL